MTRRLDNPRPRFGTLGAFVRDMRTLLRRFLDHGAGSPETALSLGGIGRELSGRTAERLARAGCLANRPAAPGRWWVTAEGREVLARWEAGDNALRRSARLRPAAPTESRP